MRGAEIPVAAEMRFLLSKESAVGSKWTYKKMRKQAVMPTASPRIFTKENIWVKRPGKGGIPAEEYNNVLGKVARKDIAADVQLKEEDLVNPAEVTL